MIQFIDQNGHLYTTRNRLAAKYNVARFHLQKILEDNSLTKISDKNMLYYLQDEVEPLVEVYLQTKK